MLVLCHSSTPFTRKNDLKCLTQKLSEKEQHKIKDTLKNVNSWLLENILPELFNYSDLNTNQT